MTYLQDYMQQWSAHWGYFPLAIGGFLFLVLILWSLIWKGLALWKAAQRGDKKWFVAFLVINTVGILEILYLYHFSKKVKSVEN